jgi:predicted anti-sigma-YlaC factor YlaD
MTQHLDALTLSRWADGLLAPEDSQRVAAHLAMCDACGAWAARQAQIAHWLSQMPPEPPPPQLARSIVAAVAQRRRSEAAWARLSAISAVAALLGLLLVALAWSDVAGLLPALAGGSAPLNGLTALLDGPADALVALANSTFDWGATLTSGAGAALLTGLVLLTGAAFGWLAQLLRPGGLDPKGLVGLEH